MSYFKAEMHQIQFRLGLHRRPRWALDLLAGFKAPTSEGSEGGGREERREGLGEAVEEGEGKREREGENVVL